MNREKQPRKLVKATLEAVFMTQEKLRKHLDVLISENRPIKDDTERDLFMRELAYGLLGLGVDTVVKYNVPSEYVKAGHSNYQGIRADVELTARWLSYQKTNCVYVPQMLFHDATGYDYNPDETENAVPIKHLWAFLLHRVMAVFPLALDRACGMSKERDESQKGIGYVIDENE